MTGWIVFACARSGRDNRTFCRALPGGQPTAAVPARFDLSQFFAGLKAVAVEEVAGWGALLTLELEFNEFDG